MLAVAVALLIRTFMFQSFYVPSDSMLPTMLVGDHVFVNKLAYGPRIPFTEIQIPGYREPERGEVVVFNLGRGPRGIYPADQRPEFSTEAFVKRLVGLPGDRVEVRDGRVYLNGEPPPDGAGRRELHRFGGTRVRRLHRDPGGVSPPDSRRSPAGRDRHGAPDRQARWLFLLGGQPNRHFLRRTQVRHGAAPGSWRAPPVSSTGPGTGMGVGFPF